MASATPKVTVRTHLGAREHRGLWGGWGQPCPSAAESAAKLQPLISISWRSRPCLPPGLPPGPVDDTAYPALDCSHKLLGHLLGIS